MDVGVQQGKAKRLRELHHAPRVLLLPNIWDPLGALLLKAAGYPAVATASAAVAFSRGFDDGERIGLPAMLGVIRDITSRVDLPVTADMESGYAEAPDAVAENMREVLRAGAVGINIEDSFVDTGALRPIDEQCRRITAIREMADREGIPLVINARVDVYVHGKVSSPEEALSETVARARAYRAAGADCIYPITLSDPAALTHLSREVQAPINVYAATGLPPLDRLLEMGVRRVSLGPGFLRATLSFMRSFAADLLHAEELDPFTQHAMTSADIRKMLPPAKLQ